MPLRTFPVAGGARFSNDWSEARPGGREHRGNDLFAEEGTPLVAVDDGVVRFGTDPLGGNVAYLRGTDDTSYYYAHLVSFAGQNRSVRAGETIGYLGRTGNAANTPPHVHFEVHPGGGAAVNPFDMLMRAPQVGRGASRSPVLPLLLVGALGLGAWALVRPEAAQRLWARLPSLTRLRFT